MDLPEDAPLVLTVTVTKLGQFLGQAHLRSCEYTSMATKVGETLLWVTLNNLIFLYFLT